MGKKGGSFEREICRRLSLWWTDDKRDDVFWRTHGSGARATVRHRAGKRTAGAYGDIMATDPIGEPLIDLLTIELKRGYNSHTIQDLLDKSDTASVQKVESWISQVEEAHTAAGSFSWLIITKRDQRKHMVMMPLLVADVLGFYHIENSPAGLFSIPVRYSFGPKKLRTETAREGTFVMSTLENFLGKVTPKRIKKAVRGW